MTCEHPPVRPSDTSSSLRNQHTEGILLDFYFHRQSAGKFSICMKPHRAVRIIRTYGQTPLLHVTGPGVPDMQPERGSQPEGGITQKNPALEHEHIQQTIVGHGPGGDSESTSIIATVTRHNQVCLMPLFPYLHLQELGIPLD